MENKERIYLDYAATTPVHPEVVKAMQQFFSEKFGNASTMYSYGVEAKEALEASRTKIAKSINAKDEEIVFTGCGTESDNFAIKGIAYANEDKGNHIITTQIEHHAVFETCKFLENRGFKVTYLPVDEYGFVDPENLKKAITSKTILVSIMMANNEIGTIEPIKEIGKIVKEKGIYFHTDAVQAYGSIPVDVQELNVDLLSTSAHKLYGPKGVGFLYIRRGTRMVSLLHGGEQERRRRAGTENVPGIVGFAAAVDIAITEMNVLSKKLTTLRDKLINGILTKIENTRLNGHSTIRLPNNVNVSIMRAEGESMLLNLDLLGISATTGSACSSSSLEPSHVLLAIGLPHEVAHGSLRFTLGRGTTESDVEKVLDCLPKIVTKLRALAPSNIS